MSVNVPGRARKPSRVLPFGKLGTHWCAVICERAPSTPSLPTAWSNFRHAGPRRPALGEPCRRGARTLAQHQPSSTVAGTEPQREGPDARKVPSLMDTFLKWARQLSVVAAVSVGVGGSPLPWAFSYGWSSPV